MNVEHDEHGTGDLKDCICSEDFISSKLDLFKLQVTPL